MLRLDDHAGAWSHAARQMWLAAGASLALLAGGCGSDTPVITISFDSPMDGASFTSDDDVDPTEPGVQIEVGIQTSGLTADDKVELLRNDVVVETLDAQESLTATVTLSAGGNALRLALVGSEREFHRIDVNFTDLCGQVSFVAPLVPEDGGDLVLGGGHEACTDAGMDVVIAASNVADDTGVTLLVNGNVVDDQQVRNGQVRFRGVNLSVRGEKNDLAVRVSAGEQGTACATVAFPASILVECEGPSCMIAEPNPGGAPLTQADDVDPDRAGLQVRVVVDTDSTANGREVLLFKNGDRDSAETAVAGMSGSGISATFASIDVPEGSPRIGVECSDDLGNVTPGSTVWNVDSEPCGIEIVGLDPEIDGDGVIAAGTPGGSQSVELSVRYVGDDCSELRASVASSADCDGVSSGAADIEIKAGDSDTLQLDLELDSAGDVFLCAEVRDEVGNNAHASRAVTFVNGAPAFQIALPSGQTDATYNKLGTGDRTADLVASSPECEARLTVSCEGPGGGDIDGTVVSFFEEGKSVPLGSGTCANGAANVELVKLPSRDVSYNIVARGSVKGLEGTSPSFAVDADCAPPSVDVSGSAPCVAGVIRPAGVNPYLADVSVLNANNPQQDVTIEVRAQSDGSLVSSKTSSNHVSAASTNVTDVSFGAGGFLTLSASTFDAAGNEGTSSCDVTVADIPELTITAPTQFQLLAQDLSGAVDYRAGSPASYTPCAGSGAFNILVTANTDAPDGAGSVQIGALSAVPVTFSGGQLSACIAADGADGKAVDIVVVSPANASGSASQTIRVAIDTAAPAAPSGIGVTSECRGFPTLDWADQAGSDNTFEAYEVRCSDDPITSHADFLAAELIVDSTGDTSVRASTINPGAAGECVVRAFDQAGAYSPMPGAATAVAATALTQVELDFPAFPGVKNVGVHPTPVGDVDGDCFGDFVVSSGNAPAGRAFLYFGGPGAGGAAPEPIEFSTTGSLAFGYVQALGNFDGDTDGECAGGTDDFAITAFGLAGQRVSYVVLGRPHRSGEAMACVGGAADDAPCADSSECSGGTCQATATEDRWPAPGGGSIVLDGSTCTADLCINGGDIVAFGRAAGSAGDFDGDGLQDYAIGGDVGTDVTVVLGGGYDRADLVAGGAGECLNVRVDADGSQVCGGTSTIPAGFRITHPEPTEGSLGGLASTGNGELFFASRAGNLYRVEGQEYPAAASGLVALNTATLALVPGIGTPTSVQNVGDFNGDGVDDLGVASISGERLRIFRGSLNGGVYGVSLSAQTTFLNDYTPIFNADGSIVGDTYTRRLATGVVPGSGSVADINGDGAAEQFCGAGSNAATLQSHGQADLLWGIPGASGANIARSVADLVAFNADTTGGPTGLCAGGTRDGLACSVDGDCGTGGACSEQLQGFGRTISAVGDFDGDSNFDLIVVEADDARADSDVARLILVGTCE